MLFNPTHWHGHAIHDATYSNILLDREVQVRYYNFVDACLGLDIAWQDIQQVPSV
jgi:hypothetical protein